MFGKFFEKPLALGGYFYADILTSLQHLLQRRVLISQTAISLSGMLIESKHGMKYEVLTYSRFDLYETLIQYVQSRGRARRGDSVVSKR